MNPQRLRLLGKRMVLAVTAFVCAAAFAHRFVAMTTRVVGPHVELPDPTTSKAWVTSRAGLREVYLEGAPESIGADHVRLLRDRMIANESELWNEYEHYVPWWIARVGLLDYSLVRYHGLDAGVPDARRRELAAQALAFAPDPLAGRVATYQRLLFLDSLYDIALPLESSPVVGCTSFALAADRTALGHVIVARSFDFEGGDAMDRDKAVFLVREAGAIPFASVAWPGFVGVVTGMNAEGVVVVVHGARAGTPASEGIPVGFSLREAIAHARTTEEAVHVLASQSVLVSHIVFVADARGSFAIVERAPGVPAYVRETMRSVAVTNHFEGPLAVDPKNARVRETTTTLVRRARIDELLGRVAPGSATIESALAMLRDHACGGTVRCEFGDRRAIDALIATHGIVADTTDRVLWVAIGPHLSGRFVRLDLRSLLAADYEPSHDSEPPQTLPEDPVILGGGAGTPAVVGAGAKP
jgi:isopenicillin-N N-acyltransferase like protein